MLSTTSALKAIAGLQIFMTHNSKLQSTSTDSSDRGLELARISEHKESRPDGTKTPEDQDLFLLAGI